MLSLSAYKFDRGEKRFLSALGGDEAVLPERLIDLGNVIWVPEELAPFSGGIRIALLYVICDADRGGRCL